MSEISLSEADQEAQLLCDETWIGPRQSRVVVLRCRGVSHREIARILNIAPGTSRRHLFDVREQYEKRYDAMVFLSNRGYERVLDRDGVGDE